MDNLALIEDNRSLQQTLQAKELMIANLLQRLKGSSPSTSFQTPLANPAAQPNPASRLKLKNPDVWSGTRTTLPRFLASCRAKFMLEAFPTEFSKIVFAGSYLGGSPGDWWQALFQRYQEATSNGCSPPPEFSSFALFSQSLTRSYGDPDLNGTMERRLYSLRQTSSVANHAAGLQLIAGYLPGWSDGPLIFHYKSRLNENIKDPFVHEKPYPKTLLEVVTATIRLDNREYKRIQERTIAALPSQPTPLASSKPTPLERSINGYAQE
jgi:Retrotransposon gag protein